MNSIKYIHILISFALLKACLAISYSYQIHHNLPLRHLQIKRQINHNNRFRIVCQHGQKGVYVGYLAGRMDRCYHICDENSNQQLYHCCPENYNLDFDSKLCIAKYRHNWNNNNFYETSLLQNHQINRRSDSELRDLYRNHTQSTWDTLTNNKQSFCPKGHSMAHSTKQDSYLYCVYGRFYIEMKCPFDLIWNDSFKLCLANYDRPNKTSVRVILPIQSITKPIRTNRYKPILVNKNPPTKINSQRRLSKVNPNGFHHNSKYPPPPSFANLNCLNRWQSKFYKRKYDPNCSFNIQPSFGTKIKFWNQPGTKTDTKTLTDWRIKEVPTKTTTDNPSISELPKSSTESTTNMPTYPTNTYADTKSQTTTEPTPANELTTISTDISIVTTTTIATSIDRFTTLPNIMTTQTDPIQDATVIVNIPEFTTILPEPIPEAAPLNVTTTTESTVTVTTVRLPTEYEEENVCYDPGARYRDSADCQCFFYCQFNGRLSRSCCPEGQFFNQIETKTGNEENEDDENQYCDMQDNVQCKTHIQ